MGSLDQALTRAINRWPESQATFWRFLSESLEYPATRAFLAGVLTLLVILSPRGRVAVLLALIAFPLANELTDVIKNAWPMPRPYQTGGMADILIRCGLSDNPGTASAHSANMAAVATIFVGRMKAWGIPWAVLAVLVGVSRVYVGAHFVSQVLLGWTCGILMALLVLGVARWIEPRRKPAEENLSR